MHVFPMVLEYFLAQKLQKWFISIGFLNGFEHVVAVAVLLVFNWFWTQENYPYFQVLEKLLDLPAEA